MKMKNTILSITSILTLALSQIASAQDSPFPVLETAPVSETEQFFSVENGEAKIEAQVIKLMVVKAEHITVSYKNDSGEEVLPEYEVRVYNRYGILLGSDEVRSSFFGGNTRLEPGDVGGEKLNLDLVDIDGVFSHAQVKLPDDFSVAAWVSLSGSNTKLREGDVDTASEAADSEKEVSDHADKTDTDAPAEH